MIYVSDDAEISNILHCGGAYAKVRIFWGRQATLLGNAEVEKYCIFVSPTIHFNNMNELIRVVEAEDGIRRSVLPDFKAGDDVNVYVKIKEGSKERIQQFQGTVIQRKNVNTNGETFTIRKLSGGVGVERIFPLLSPNIDKIEVTRRGVVRRARLYYLRGKQGRAAKVKEKRM